MTPTDHPDRMRVLAELHARPFTPTPTPQRLLHFAFQVTPEQAERDRERMERMVGATSQGKDGRSDQRYLRFDEGRLRWERHGEFISYTLVTPLDAIARWPVHLVPPGQMVVAIDLRLTTEEPQPPAMVHAEIVDGGALILSDFRADESGFVPITIINRSMTEEIAGATVQRVLEIETYRCFALLGLPVAETAALAMAAIEHELLRLMEKMDAAWSVEDNRALLDRLTSMALELERSSATTHFRFGATKAYAELVRLRLQTLAERAEHGRPGLSAFFSRRFEPAIRTCATASEREANLARKLTRAAQLLRTRVEIALESQNRDLLETMANRVRLQLRLQQTVEGLSVAAIAYYVASLFHLLMDGLHSADHRVDPEFLTALAIIPIVIMVGLAVRRVRRHGDIDRAPGVTADAAGPPPSSLPHRPD